MTENGSGNMVLPVAPMGVGYGGGNGGDGFFGGNSGWWIILLLIVLGGWGNGFGGYGGGMGGGSTGYVVNDVQRGFDQNAVITGITGVQNAVTNGFSDVQQALCNGFAGVASGFAQAEISENARQMANMQQMFGIQSAITDCCCRQSANTADLKYTIASEAGNTRAANTANTQAILDKLCALELDGVKGQLEQARRDNVNLQNQLNMANLAASQTAQTVNIRDSIIDELRSCPIPSQPVYGSQPIFTCSGNNGCGCGGNF